MIQSWLILDLAGRTGINFPDVGISRSLSLPRAHAEAGLQLEDWASARLGMAMVRSGGEDGYVGVDGEALVPEVQIAEARGDYAPWGLSMGAGVVDDPWVSSGDAAWGLRAIAPTLGEAAGWLDSSDLGSWLRWAPPEHRLSVRLDLSSGEGARYRERNEGKDIAATVSFQPLRSDPEFLVLSVYARDGSRGLGLARDHRAGLRAGGNIGAVGWGAEGLAAWGVAGDATRQPLAASFWLSLRPSPLLSYARLDIATESFGEKEAGSHTFLAGVGLELPEPTQHPLQLVAGYSGTRVGDGVAGIAGASTQENTNMLFLQLGVFLSTR